MYPCPPSCSCSSSPWQWWEWRGGGDSTRTCGATNHRYIWGVWLWEREWSLLTVFLLQQQVKDTKNEMSYILADLKEYMVTMNTNNVHCIATQPVVCPVTTAATTTVVTKVSSCFWIYLYCGAGSVWRKGSQGLHSGWTGTLQNICSHRKGFLDAVLKLMARGYTSDSASDQIQGVYGRRMSVTPVIKRMKKDWLSGIERFWEMFF